MDSGRKNRAPVKRWYHNTTFPLGRVMDGDRDRLDAGGLAGLVPARPGPPRAHKLTDEVVAFARGRLASDPTLRSADLVELITERFGVRVHCRSIQRALARAATPQEEGDR